MKQFYAHLAFFLCLAVGSAQAATYQPLIEAPALNKALTAQAQLQMIDIRSPEDYAAGHIPGAVSAPYGQWRGPADNPGQLANDADFQTLIRQLGLTDQQPIVVYSSGADETDFGAAARVYWTLKYLGLSDLSVLNGGFQQWQRAQQPISIDATQVSASQLTVQSNPKLVILKDELLEKITQQDNSYQLLDARPPLFYQGKVKAPTASIGGTIATAQNTPFQQWFNDSDTRIRPIEEIKQMVHAQGLDQAQETVSFCNTGHWAATNWFVLSELAGLKDVRLYPASLAEWTQTEVSLPMENTPSRWEQLQSKFSKRVND
ncbi:MAG: sulfurtransferase [Pseudomonas sp.]|jgi:thiosulfate/3-mercaptopyruvate sulfurtransferase|nr:sulfurtransferase [Pseudomonas sp.]